jgi:hypothetical protein
MSAQRHHREQPRGLRRHRKTLIAVAAVLALAWLAWNALLVESDVESVAVEAPADGAAEAP